MSGPESNRVWGPIRDGVRKLMTDGKMEPDVNKMIRIETPTQVGVPDVIYQFGEAMGWFEMKFVAQWPAKEETATTLGLTPKQALFLQRWAKPEGALAWLVVRVGEQWLVLWGGGPLGVTHRAEWERRAILNSEGKPPWDVFVRVLSQRPVGGLLEPVGKVTVTGRLAPTQEPEMQNLKPLRSFVETKEEAREPLAKPRRKETWS